MCAELVETRHSTSSGRRAAAAAPVPAVRQTDQAENESAYADLQPYATAVCRKPVVGKRKDHRYQAEDGCANRDNR